MIRIARFVLIALYPLLLAGRAIGWLLGRDRLRLKKRSRPTYWVAREPSARPRSYFVDAPSNDAATPIAAAAIALAAGRLGAADRQAPVSVTTAQPADIPDEIYTLW